MTISRLTARKERMNSRATHNKSQELPVASFSPPAIPQLYAADGTLLPGRCLQLPDGTRVPLVEGRRREASQRRRLFGISTVERLLQVSVELRLLMLMSGVADVCAWGLILVDMVSIPHSDL